MVIDEVTTFHRTPLLTPLLPLLTPPPLPPLPLQVTRS